MEWFLPRPKPPVAPSPQATTKSTSSSLRRELNWLLTQYTPAEPTISPMYRTRTAARIPAPAPACPGAGRGALAIGPPETARAGRIAGKQLTKLGRLRYVGRRHRW